MLRFMGSQRVRQDWVTELKVVFREKFIVALTILDKKMKFKIMFTFSPQENNEKKKKENSEKHKLNLK